MFSVLRRHLSYANVAATLAVVFAMSGGAYAVSNTSRSAVPVVVASAAGYHHSVSASVAKKKGKSAPVGKPGPRGPAGPVGPAGATGSVGPAGPAGPAGAKGETGASGSNGGEGKAGESVKVGQASLGECPSGGAKLSNASGSAAVCSAQGGGGGGFVETLPPEKTETGVWKMSFVEGSKDPYEDFTTISFPVRLAETLFRNQVHYVGKEGGGSGSACPGTVEAPTATPGNLCVYQLLLNGVPTENDSGEPMVPEIAPIAFTAFTTSEQGASTTGAMLKFQHYTSNEPEKGTEGEAQLGFGTWAVTAPPAEK
jgi:Collagen triple helix repeat (20 copies)